MNAADNDENALSSAPVIRHINIRLHPIFDESNPKENYWLFKLANRLHWGTYENVIKQDLLFSEGEVFDQQKLDESERILRARNYLNRVAITTEKQDDGSIDVNVDANEVWTLFLTASFSRSGGNNESSYGFKDTNFLGYGKTVAFSRNTSDERDSDYFEYFDPNTGWHQTNFTLAYEDNSDGFRYFSALNRPYFSLKTPTAGGFSAEKFESEVTLYNAGDDVDGYGHRGEYHSLFYGTKLSSSNNNRIYRLNVGYSYEENNFFLLPDESNSFILPQDRKFHIAWLEYQTVPNAFIEAVNIRQINRVEDINLGVQGRWRLGYVLSPDDRFNHHYYLASDISSSWMWNKNHLLSGHLDLRGFYTDEGVQNGLASTTVNYYWKNFSRGQFYIRLHGDRGLRLFSDQFLILGGDNGLRGYPDNYTAGSHRYLATVEQRFYGQKEWFSLFHVGAAIFYDQGRAWGETLVPQDFDGHLRNWGVGLRISGTRNGGRDEGANNVFHLDVAQPLDGGDDLDQWQWSATVRTRF